MSFKFKKKEDKEYAKLLEETLFMPQSEEEQDKYAETIESFINRRFPIDCNWMDGNCLYFAKILTSRFKRLEIWYMPITGHFVAYRKGYKYYFDWKGRHEFDKMPDDEKEAFESLKTISEKDKVWGFRLIFDCMN